MGKNNPETLRKYHKEYYQQNKAKIKARVIAWQKRRLDELRRYVYDYLIAHPCVECGETNPVVLEFDHRDDQTKVSAIADLILRLCSTKKLQAEIDKCQVRCANCHRIRTAKKQGYYCYLYQQEEVKEECAPYWIASDAA